MTEDIVAANIIMCSSLEWMEYTYGHHRDIVDKQMGRDSTDTV